MTYHIAIAGSTNYTLLMTKALADDPRFSIEYVVTPAPKKINRQYSLQKNPMQLWGEVQQLPLVLVDKKLNETAFNQLPSIDFLLVVDFGYFVPSWLLNIPKIAPLNIHPSLLPKWRGSSPGQFALLFQNLGTQDSQSGITLMIMNNKLDQGPIIAQFPFEMAVDWNQTVYYQQAFALIKPLLTDLIDNFAQGKIKAQAQTLVSPTMIARKLTKGDSFFPWLTCSKLMTKDSELVSCTNDPPTLMESLLNDRQLCPTKNQQVQLVVQACRAFDPWPGLWTLIPTARGEQRMKILAASQQKQQLALKKIQIEGKTACSFNEGKNIIVSEK